MSVSEYIRKANIYNGIYELTTIWIENLNIK